jgi:signal transduction histidine kinase/PAS domain-containing protein
MKPAMTPPDDVPNLGRPDDRPSEAHYFSLLDNAPEAIVSFRAGQGAILEVNAQAERLLGRGRDTLIGTPFVAVFSPEHHDPIAWLVAQTDGAPLRLEDLSIRRPPQPAPPTQEGADAVESPREPHGDDTLGRNRGRRATDPRPEMPATEPPDSFGASTWQRVPDPFRADLDEVDAPSGRGGRVAEREEIPVSLSCNWIRVRDSGADDNGSESVVAQAILRDVTSSRQMRRELETYAVQLEERVAARTREVQQSEERYRALFLQEQRRAQHLSLINEVQRCALSSRELDEFPHCCTRAIQEHFRRGDASFYLVDSDAPWSSLDTSPSSSLALNGGGADTASTSSRTAGVSEEFDLVCVAQAGGHGLAPAPGSRHSSRVGVVGEAARSGEILHRTGERGGEAEERAPGVYRDAASELAVPIVLDGRVLGVLAVQSEDTLAFDARDAVALQTASNIIASHLHSSRLFNEMGELNDFHHALVNTMLHSLMVVDGRGRLEVVNERLCSTLSLRRDQLIGQPMERVFGQSVIEQFGLDEAISDVTLNGTPREIPEVHVRTPDGAAVFDLRIFRVFFRGEAKAVILAINITVRWRKAHQVETMHEIGHFFQASLDINRVLHTVLTCITAGPALGFNRAFVLLRDSSSWLEEGEADSDVLVGAMALGPSSSEEASRIWSELSQRNPSLHEILGASIKSSNLLAQNSSPLQHETRGLALDLDDPALQVLAGIVREGRATRMAPFELFPLSPLRLSLSEPNGEAESGSEQVLDGDTGRARVPMVSTIEAARKLFVAPDMAIAPLLAKERVVGVVLADNLYSGAPIDEDDVQLLDILAQQAGLTIDNALTYQALQKAQRGLVSAERLAAVGEMAARVSHEIRNPLATIGGFARSVLKKPDEAEGVGRKVGIIVDEVTRLEELLTDLLDMARPRALNLTAHNISEVVTHALLLADADIRASGVVVERDLAPDLPALLLDRSRLLQAVLNIVRNGAQAMADKSGGKGGASNCGSPEEEDRPCVMTISTRLLNDCDPPMAEIAVRDEGVGISERAVQQIFDPFFSTKVSGSGLGLAVTRRILQDHGGDISVESQESEGTTFFLRFPARTPEAADPAPRQGQVLAPAPAQAETEAAHEEVEAPNN